MKVSVKSFLFGINGEQDGRQDALAFNIDKGIYAIADGVSNSFHPEIVSKLLCEMFLSMDIEDSNQLVEYIETNIIPEIKQRWEELITAKFQTLSGRLLRHELYNYETFHCGASTFCGIIIDQSKHTIKYAILGDSTLFIKTKENNTIELNSTIHNDNSTENAPIIYSNTTDAVLSNGTIVGHWLSGEFPIENVLSVSLMTDGMAKWFQQNLQQEADPESTIWDLQSDEDFYKFATNGRFIGELDDDLAIIIIRPDISNENNLNVIGTTTKPSADEENKQTIGSYTNNAIIAVNCSHATKRKIFNKFFKYRMIKLLRLMKFRHLKINRQRKA